jgi:hypothetical protein
MRPKGEIMDFIKSVQWYRWLGVALFLAAAVGGSYWGISAPADLVEGEVGVTLAGRIGTVVMSILMGGGGAAITLLVGRK